MEMMVGDDVGLEAARIAFETGVPQNVGDLEP
jgi:hypothetical protein